MSLASDLSSRILILDGAMGTMLQRGLSEEEVLRAYIDAGADIITTNSFSANRLSLAKSEPGVNAWQKAYSAASLARKVADSYNANGSQRHIYVAGSVSPTGISLTLPSSADDPAFREVDFDTMASAYREQIDALVRGGVDVILLETCFDALNAKAAIYALSELGNPVPIIISATVSDRSGRTLTGQTLEAFYTSVKHAPGLLAFGVNCALGAEAMEPLVREVASFSSHPVIFYPNAGLPDEMGRYNDSPATIAAVAARLASDGLVSIFGGCCGTTPAHIRAIAEAVRCSGDGGCVPADLPPSAGIRGFHPQTPGGLSAFPCLQANTRPGRPADAGENRPITVLTVSGLEAVTIDPARNFTNIGERTNVAGSAKFKRLVETDAWDEALQVAAAQIEGGATIIDINMDDPMVDSSEKMRTFLRHIAGEPAVAKAAIMIDSSDWSTILEGLKNAQGKCIVNSISLKEGEQEFLRKAQIINSFGAAMVVMAFDELGQAVTYSRKVEICERSYRLLTSAGIKPEDIIFDCNILPVCQGAPDGDTSEDESRLFAIDFIEAVRWIKANLPGAKTSGGVSNLSFSFRGNNTVREAMHSVFLYHAIRAGLDMAIVNPQMLRVYDDIPSDLRQAVEDVILNSRPDATERLIALAQATLADANGQNGSGPNSSANDTGVVLTAQERLSQALVRGGSHTLETDVLDCLQIQGSAVAVIEGPLMSGMERVGQLFADGKMFLPQVVKSAKVMRDAVAILQPYMGTAQKGSDRPKFLIATVQGDVHDIGKNITAIVLQCSGFEVIDLGVMVPASQILDAAIAEKVDIIGVSGLITPSLQRMEELCAEMTRRGLSIPLFVGGAAASAVHTAVKLSPIYSNVHYGADASATAVMAKKYISAPEAFLQSESATRERLLELRKESIRHRGNEDATVRTENTPNFGTKSTLDPTSYRNTPYFRYGLASIKEYESTTRVKLSELLPFFDWKMFRAICGLCPTCGDKATEDEAREFLRDAGAEAVLSVRFFHAHRNGDDIVCTPEAGSVHPDFRLPMLRGGNGSLADFIPTENGQIGLFAATITANGTTSNPLISHAALCTLAEAASAWIHDKVTAEVPEGVKVIMPGVGYACCPDHSLKRDILAHLPAELGITLTDSCAMIPEASVCGLVIAHPEARYTDIRRISRTSVQEYATRRGMTDQEARLFLGALDITED